MGEIRNEQKFQSCKAQDVWAGINMVSIIELFVIIVCVCVCVWGGGGGGGGVDIPP